MKGKKPNSKDSAQDISVYNSNIYVDKENLDEKGFVDWFKDSISKRQRDKFFKAIKNNDEKQISKLLKHKFDINTFDEAGNTAIDIICETCRDEYGNITTDVIEQECSLKLLRFLVKNGANPDTMIKTRLRYSYVKQPLLIFAVEMEDKKLVNLLIEQKANLNVENHENETALNVSARMDNRDLVGLLVRNGADVNHAGRNNDTALHVACRRGNVYIVELLTQNGADVNILNGKKETPLIIATLKNNTRIAYDLLKSGANPNIKKNGKVSVLDIAINNNNMVLADVFLKMGVWFNKSNANIDDFLAHALVNKKNELVRRFLKEDINEISKSKLISAVIALNNKRLAKELMEDNIITYQDGELLQNAIINDDMDIVMKLISKDFPVNFRFEYLKSTPLIMAIERGQRKLVRFLLENGADVNLADIYGDNALHVACKSGDFEIFNMVLDKCTNVNRKNKDDEAPIHIVCENNDAKKLRYLMRKGANINLLTSIQFKTDRIVGLKMEGGYKTPLCVAAQNKSRSCIKLLVQNGANVEKDIEVAIKRGNIEVVLELVDYMKKTPELENIIGRIRNGDFSVMNRLMKICEQRKGRGLEV